MNNSFTNLTFTRKPLLIILHFVFCSLFSLSLSAKDYVEYVNPLMGTLSEHLLSTGNTYPAIARPWGMNFWTPQTGKMGDGWAYRYDRYQICGIKQTHQPSPWINDYGQFSIMPVVGMKLTEDARKSWYSHKAEVAKPHYYKVYFADHDIVTELTPTERAAYFKFTFPQSDSSAVVIDAFDKGSHIKIIPSENKVVGYSTKNSGGVPDNFKNYFVIVFDKPFDFKTAWDNFTPLQSLENTSHHAGAIIGFRTKRGEAVHAKVASSFISIEQAELNLKELDNKNFSQTVEEGRNVWNKTLSVIDIDANIDQMRTFYSCLYRSLLFPRMFYEYDNTGKVVHYSPYNGKIEAGYLFTDTGFWDTFRALFPLLNLLYPSMNVKMQEGLLNTFKESGFLPEWASPGHRDCMVGTNSVSVVADAILKDITPKNLQLPLYEAMIKTVNSNHPTVKSTGRLGFEEYNKLGYVPCDIGIRESAARTLEYAYNDWCIYRVAQKLNRPKNEIELYKKRSANYRNLFDKEHLLMRGKKKDGSFQTPFNPLKWGDAFTEGNSWHYSWSVFHDIPDLMKLMGGTPKFTQMLDSIFILPPVFDESYYGFVIHEIREMQIMNMGNYAHGNQPAQHILYLYDYTPEPWKGQYWIRETMDKLYTPTPDGYCGDEDNGQTSAWYVFSALGFYPVCPGSSEYLIGSPLVKKATLTLENGKSINITASNNTTENRYIETMTVNQKNYTANYLRYPEITQGTTIDFTMSKEPNKNRGTQPQDFPKAE